MSYKFLLLVFFSFYFSLSPAVAAIPVQPAAPAHETLVEKKKKKAKKVRPKERTRNGNRNGLLSLIFGICGLIIFPPLAIPAIVLGIIALSKKEPNKVMPILGIVFGGLVVLAVILILYFLLILL
jgi:hypothetical protein